MNNFCKFFIISLIFSFLNVNIYAQYGDQFANRGFEEWNTIDGANEPVHWHSGGTASGTFSNLMPTTMEQSTQFRPGSLGFKSIRLVPSSILGVTANGSVTNGRINAGSMSAGGSGNYNYTVRSNSIYNTPMTMIPDSLTVWVCFRSQSSTDKAHVKAVVHGDADFKLVANGTEDPANMHVAAASMTFTRTSSANGAYTWRRLSIPFVNDGPCTDIRYLLLFATTNETPGSGSTNDDLFLDDILLVYNPSLSMGQLESTAFAPGDVFSLPFTLTGTMSPDNLNAAANVVIAQLSDANGSFNNPTEIGRLTTNTSGSIIAHIPNNVADGNYQLRVISTNYPMVGQNIQQVSVALPSYVITATANPVEGGTVTGGNTYFLNQDCTLSATAAPGYTFVNWTENGNVITTDAEFTLVVAGNRNFVANFSLDTYTITATAHPTAGGTVTGDGSFVYGATCTLEATANEGYTFVDWTKDGVQVTVDESYTFTVESSGEYVANFRRIDNVDERTSTEQLFPNPFGTSISVKAEKIVDNISIYDLFGRLVKQISVSDKEINLDLSDLSAGAYLLQLDYGDSKSVHRIVKSE